MEKIEIRSAVPSDAKSLVEIYSYYVLNTAITYEYDVPSVKEFSLRIKDTLQKMPYIVAVVDGKIAGYAYASFFNERKAYEHSAELSIYLDKDKRHNGLGTKLYSELEKILLQKNFTNLYACIAATSRENDSYLTDGNIKFHSNRGFKIVGRFTSCAYKFNLWYDMVYMEKFIAPHK